MNRDRPSANDEQLPSVPEGFHYDRGARMRLASAGTRRAIEAQRRRGLFRGNRHLIILLIDVVVIAVLFVIAARFLVGSAAGDSIGPYALRLTATGIGGATLVELIITNERVLARSRPNVATVRFSFPGGAESIRVEAQLPQNPGEQATVPVLLATPATETDVVVRVFVGDDNAVLAVAVGGPATGAPAAAP